MMKSFSGLLALSGLAVVFATVPISQVPRYGCSFVGSPSYPDNRFRQNSFPVVPGAVIVELDAVSDVPGTQKRGLVDVSAPMTRHGSTALIFVLLSDARGVL